MALSNKNVLIFSPICSDLDVLIEVAYVSNFMKTAKRINCKLYSAWLCCTSLKHESIVYFFTDIKTMEKSKQLLACDIGLAHMKIDILKSLPETLV